MQSGSVKKELWMVKKLTPSVHLSFSADCCVHCILACLFCEFLTLCNIVLDCATCGSCAGDDSCFCCCCASEECGDCDLPCDMDCGIIDACCESADCLEICMECCSLCFSSWGPEAATTGSKVDVCYTLPQAQDQLWPVSYQSWEALHPVFVAWALWFTLYWLAQMAPQYVQCFLQGLPRKRCDLMLSTVTGEFFLPLLIQRWDSSLPWLVFAVGPLLHSRVYGAEWVPVVVHECLPGCANRASGPSQNKLLLQWSPLCRLNDWSSPSMKNDLQRQMRKWLHLTGF